MYVYSVIKCVVRWSESSMRFEKSNGNWLPDGPNSVRLYLKVRYGMCVNTHFLALILNIAVKIQHQFQMHTKGYLLFFMIIFLLTFFMNIYK